MSPQQPLHVLIAEDSRDDADLLVKHLRRAGYDPQFEVVATPAQFRSALTRQSWDLVLCDYSMGAFDALAAHAILKERGQDIPFIIVSGTIGEEEAAEAMRAGAHDFFVKGRLSRLAPAIARELREAVNRWERREQERVARAAIELQAALVDNVYDAVIGADAQLVVTAWNCAAEQLYGWPRDEAVGRRLDELVPTAQRILSSEEIARRAGSAGRLKLELTQQTRTGARVEVESTAVALFNADGTPRGYVFVNRDVSDRKRAPAPKQRRGHGEIVLLVDDEEGLRAQARRILERNGFRVLESSGGDEALQSLAQHREVNLVLSDVVMPHGSGTELALQLQQRRPELPVVLMSGFPDRQGAKVLRKPFTEDALLARIGEALAQAGQPGALAAAAAPPER
jgi:PAS domain S-box-containing protein